MIKDLTAIQILRENNLANLEVSKSTVFTIFKALKMPKSTNLKIQSLWMVKMVVFGLKMISRKICIAEKFFCHTTELISTYILGTNLEVYSIAGETELVPDVSFVGFRGRTIQFNLLQNTFETKGDPIVVTKAMATSGVEGLPKERKKWEIW